MRKISDSELKEVIEKHALWLEEEPDGVKADLSRTDLSYTDLSYANLEFANLSNTQLHNANLYNTNFSYANLYNTNFSYANLSYAHLYGVDLSNTILCNTNLHNIEANGNIVSVGPIGSRNAFTIYLIKQDIVKCGCWNNYRGDSLEEFEARIEEIYPADCENTLLYRNQYLAAIACFKTLREQRNVKERA